jgi:hypothetical protein
MGEVSGFRFQVSSFKIANENSSSFFVLVFELLLFWSEDKVQHATGCQQPPAI